MQPTHPRRTQIAALTLLLGSSLLAGCVTESSEVERDEPIALSPGGADPSSVLPKDQRPPSIVITDPNGFTRTTIEPTIFDTRDVSPRHQITGAYTGQIRPIKNELEAREELLEGGKPKVEVVPNTQRTLPVGQAIDVDRVRTAGGGGFTGIAQTEWSPPDPTIAVGPNHIVETVNAAIAFYDKNTGNQTFSVHLGTPGNPGFFEPVGADSSFVFDPKCFYDQKAGRFVVIGLETSGASWIDIAVSDDDDPNGIWYKYRTYSVINVSGSDYWVDYPGFGFDDNAWYVTGNLFPLDGSGFGGQLFRVFPKAPMLNGDPVTFFDLAPDNGASLQVAQMFGPAPQCYFVSRANTAALRLWTINDPTTSPSWDRVVVGGIDSATGPSQDAPNRGGGLISTLDGRIMNVHCRDGDLYAAHAINGAPGVTVARWYHIDINGWPTSGNNPTLVEQGDVSGDNDRHYFYPAIYSDRDHNVGMVTASSSPDTYASVRVSGRFPTDPAGTMSVPIQLAIGDRGADGRWGDYLDIAIDPNDDKTFWIVGMYQRNFGWQTWIDSFTITLPCPADLDNNGVLDFFDISQFIILFNTQSPGADLNNDGVWDFFDVSLYIQAFQAGCP